jgi:arylsulfatase A-like enzyme
MVNVKCALEYYGMISEVDFQLGRVVAALEERGEWDDTIVVITSDHGEQLGDHGLKEKLGFLSQSYHVLGLWRDPARVAAGTKIDAPTENVDIFPTLCEAMGIDIPAESDGRSLMALFRGRLRRGDALFTTNGTGRYFFLGGSSFYPYNRNLARDRSRGELRRRRCLRAVRRWIIVGLRRLRRSHLANTL